MKNNEQEIRRFAKKWSSCLVDIDLKAHKIQEDACLSDLTALISERYVEKAKYDEAVNQEVEKRMIAIEKTREDLITTEVEKRIKERTPSKEEINKEAGLLYSKEIFIVACEWILSRLTCSEKPNNSQKTKGGAK